MFARIRSFARILVRRDDFERTLSEEMRFHMQACADDLIRAGVAPDEAQRRARIEFGPRGALEEECREARGARFVDELRQDVRYAARQLRRSPGFTVAAVLSLALGIGANSAIFGLMDAIVLRTLPIRDPAALFFLGHSGGGEFSTSSNYPLLARYQSSRIFEQVTSTTLRSFHIATPEGLERVEGEYVSGNYHATLGVRLALGRGFSNEPDRPDGRAPVAVISDAYWERRFARTPDVIGRTLSIGGRTITIVGVTAPGFHGVSPGLRIDVSLPLYVRAMDDAGFLDQRDRWISVRIVGRLRAEQTEAQALAAVDGLFRRYWSEPENGMEPGSVRFGSLIPAGRGTTGLRDRYGTPLRLLFAMVAIVLLIACTNVANLFLARGVSRAREIAVRLSLGAGRARLVRQMVTESALLAIAGGVFGLVFAIVSMRFIASTFATGERPLVIDVGLSGRVMAFTAGLSIVCSLLVGLIPALRSSRIDVTPALKDSATRPTAGRWSLGRLLVVTQLALSCLIVSVASLLARTVFNLQSIDAGFSGERALLFNLDAGGEQLSVEGRAAFFSTLATRLRALPGVRAVAYTQRSPLDNSVQTRPIEIPGFVIPKELRGISANVVTPQFFDIFDIRLMRGRTLTTEDRAGSEPVAVVDDAMVKAFFGSADPLGRRVIIGADRESFTIVGVVRSGRTDNLREEPFRTIYTSLAQSRLGSNEAIGDARRITVVVQSTTGGAALAASVRAEIASLSPHVVVNYVRTMEQQVATAMLRERLMAVLSTSYGLLALLLSLVGLYGVTSFTVSQRTRDIGVRMALGATRQRVVNAILGETVLTATIGIVIGGVATLFAANLVAPFLFGIEPRDPLTLGGVAVLLSATALIAGYIPGRRAASIDPVRALKD